MSLRCRRTACATYPVSRRVIREVDLHVVIGGPAGGRVARGSGAGPHAVSAVPGLGRGGRGGRRGSRPRAHAVGTWRPALHADVRRGRFQLVLAGIHTLQIKLSFRYGHRHPDKLIECKINFISVVYFLAAFY